jgi:galactokinase
VGGVLFQDFSGQVRLEAFSLPLGTFVLGDSQQAKDTRGILKRVKFGVLRAIEKIHAKESGFELESVKAADVERYASDLSKDEYEVLQGALLNRDLTREAIELFRAPKFDHRLFGKLMNEHQKVLAGLLQISTPKIDRMLQAAMNAGAYGGKINGSGGGGCMFVYAPENPEAVAKAIEREGGKAFVVQTASGVEG